MSEGEGSSQRAHGGATAAFDGPGAILACVVGAAGGAAAAALANGSPSGGALAGVAFGFVAAATLRGQAPSAGSGLVWGLGGGFLLWILLSLAGARFHPSAGGGDSMLRYAQERIPGLLACVVGIGAPVGVALGIRGGLRPGAGRFHWGKALTAGGISGVVAALIFSRWMYEGDFFPLISGLGGLRSHAGSVLLHVAVACAIGCTFGALFQNDVRNLGSSMGWGMAYAIFWWILGSMTLFPVLTGQRPDWSASHANAFFGPLVGYVFFGLILGIVYSGVNLVWTRLFVDSDPVNRKREGPGIHFILSVAWGSAAGIAGGVVALPLMIQTGVITRVAGLDGGLPLYAGVLLHLGASTVIGASYGILFRGESADAVSSSLWGFVVGLIAWYAGPLTLLPLLRTGECDWRPEAAAALLPSLVCHLLYGVVTANVFSAFERAMRRRLDRARRPSSGPFETSAAPRPTAALSLFVLGLGILLPILLS